MECYGQIIYESGSYGVPGADDYQTWESVSQAKGALASTWNDRDVSPVDGQGVTLLLWMGKPDPEVPFPCDGANFHHDRAYELGPRLGVRRID